jgi:hypothetical protein
MRLWAYPYYTKEKGRLTFPLDHSHPLEDSGAHDMDDEGLPPGQRGLEPLHAVQQSQRPSQIIRQKAELQLVLAGWKANL